MFINSLSLLTSLLKVLINALSSLPVLLNSVDSLNSPRCHSNQLMTMARQVNAALCALGGFQEMIKPGCHVTVTGNVEHSTGTVVSVSTQTGLVTVKLDPQPEDSYSPRYSESVQVPQSRLQPCRNKVQLYVHVQIHVSFHNLHTFYFPTSAGLYKSTYPSGQPISVGE